MGRAWEGEWTAGTEPDWEPALADLEAEEI